MSRIFQSVFGGGGAPPPVVQTIAEPAPVMAMPEKKAVPMDADPKKVAKAQQVERLRRGKGRQSTLLADAGGYGTSDTLG